MTNELKISPLMSWETLPISNCPQTVCRISLAWNAQNINAFKQNGACAWVSLV